MSQSNIVILGGGMVAGYAAKQLVELRLPKGELAILSADNAVPYERPPLSKGFLAGKDSEDAIKINPDEFYKEHGIELRLQCEVAAVNLKGKRLILKNGDESAFKNLLSQPAPVREA
jgi:NAD(P)H-nitrite reductase large subunit